MKIRGRLISFALAACLVATMFSFAPAAFAQTEPENREEAPVAVEKTAEPQQQETSPQAAAPKTVYTITAENGSGGSVQLDKQSAAAGDMVAYTITPNTGYKIETITVNGAAAENKTPYAATKGSFTIAQDSVVKAEFAKCAAYTIKVSTNNSKYGTVKTSASSVKENGKTNKVTITSAPKSGYYLSDLKVNGKSVGAKKSYVISNVTKNTTAAATFKKQIKIMLDAGHYGNYYNHSPVLSSYYESNMTWQLHLYLKAELEKYNGFYVGTTRASKAKDLNVYYRGTASKGYNLFLSLHSNYSDSRSSDAPLVIKQKTNAASSALIKGLGSAMQKTMDTNQNYTYWSRTNNDGKTEYYGVLRGAAYVNTPGLILEHSFHSNLRAAKWLSSNSNLKKMAAAEAKVLADYYNLENEDNTGDTGDADPGTNQDPAETPVTTVATTDKVKVTVSSLAIRKGPATSYAKMGTAKKGATYQLKARTKDGIWGQLKTNGYWFYLKGYTSLVKPAAAEPTPSTVATTQKVKVNVSSLAIRKGPATSYAKVGTAKKGATYQLKAKTKDGIWGQLKTNGYWFYLKGYTSVVKTTPSNTVSSKAKIKVTVSNLNLRKSPSTSAKKMGTAKKNKVYQLKAKTKDGIWGQLKTNGYWLYLKGYTKNV